MRADAGDAPVPPRLRPAGPVIRAHETGIWSEAASVIGEAQRYADRMKAWAQTAYERERQRGFAEGWSAGAEEASRLIAKTAARTELHLRELERDLPQLVLDVVERILGSFDPGEVLALAVEEALRDLRTGSEIRVHVSPDLADQVRASLADLRHGEGAALVRVHADSGLPSGACVLHGAFGSVELGIEAQLRALRAGLGSAWAGHSPASDVGSSEEASP